MSRYFDLMQQLDREAEIRGHRTPRDSSERPRSDTASPAGEIASADEGAFQLAQRVFLLCAKPAPRVAVFAGIEPGDSSSRIAASVAETLARNSPGSVCLVEANFRSPVLPRLLGTTNHHGLTDALLGEGPIRSFTTPVLSNTVWLLSAGALAADSPSLLSSERIRARMLELRDEFEFVVVDAPPLSRYTDALAISRLADGLVLVLEAGATRREAAQLAAANLRSCEIPILGAVLNNRTFPIPEKLYRML